MVEALSEAFVLAEKSKLSADSLHAWLEVMYGKPYTTYFNRLKNGEYYLGAPYWGARLALKDYRHAKSLADSGGVEVKGLDVAGKHTQDIIDYYGDENKGDIAGLYGIVRQEAGLDFENQK